MNAFRPYVVPISIIRRDWLTQDAPELHLALSDGAHLKVQWSLEDQCAYLFVAKDSRADFVSCTAAETGLEPGELAGLVDEVFRAVRADEDERLADEWAGRDDL